jgi:hypothetical protein
LQEFASISNITTEAIGFLHTAMDKANLELAQLSNFAVGAGTSLSKMGDITSHHAEQFGLLAAGVIKAKDSFSGLAGIDTSTLNTFNNQLQEMNSSLLSNDTALGEMRSGLISLLQASGAAPDILKKAFTEPIAAIEKIAKNILDSADNGLKLQNAFIQLSAQTGNLHDLYKKAGDSLGGMNSLLLSQTEMMNDTEAATGATAKQVNDYYIMLGKIPGALNATVQASAEAGSKTSNLTAVMKLAAAGGYSMEQMAGTLKKALVDYGLTGTSALTFTARFGELAEKFGIELGDVREQLIKSADTFGRFANAGAAAGKMSEGLAAINKDYVESLKGTGMTGQHAIAVVGEMTNAMSGLSIAQKAFLSAQTGGPGGLMGGVQIEQMLRKGDIAGVQKKMMEAMKKQFGGEIVTQDQAAQSESAARKYTEQKMLLQQGPLGSMVKTDEDAARMLEAMKGGTTFKAAGAAMAEGGTGMGLETKGLQDALEKGTQIQELSRTKLTDINANADQIARNTSITNLSVVQRGMTARSGNAQADNQDALHPDVMKSRQDMLDNARVHTQAGGSHTERLAGQTQMVDRTAEVISNSIRDVGTLVKQLPTSVSAFTDNFKDAINSGSSKKITDTGADIEKAIAQKKQEIAGSSKPQAEKDKALAQLNKDESAVTRLVKEAIQKTEITKSVATAAATQTPTAPRGTAAYAPGAPQAPRGTAGVQTSTTTPLTPRGTATPIAVPLSPGRTAVSSTTPMAPKEMGGVTQDQFANEAEKMLEVIKNKFGTIVDAKDAAKNKDAAQQYNQEKKMISGGTLGKMGGKDFNIDMMLSDMKQAETNKTKLRDNEHFSASKPKTAASAPGAPGAVPAEVKTVPTPPKAKTFKLPGDPSLDPDDPNFGSSTATTAGSKLAEAPRAPVAASAPSTAPTRRPGEVATTTSQPAPAPTVHVTKEGPSGAKIYVTVKVEDSPQSHSIAPVPTP